MTPPQGARLSRVLDRGQKNPGPLGWALGSVSPPISWVSSHTPSSFHPQQGFALLQGAVLPLPSYKLGRLEGAFPDLFAQHSLRC